MAIDFPTSPTPGQQVTSGSRTWTWSGTYWANNTITGVQGTQGIQGTQGTQGVQGIQGLLGTQGSQGLQGIQGIQGVTGAQGITGIQGTQGTQGLQGIMGAQGAQGTQGTQGAQGIQGSQGTQGLQGITGAQGISGASILGTNNTWTGTNAFASVTATSTTPTTVQLTRSSTSGSQLILGSTYAPTVGTIYSSANVFFTSNAYQTTDSSDAWAKGSGTYSSNSIRLGTSTNNASYAFQIARSPANTANGAIDSFFTQTLLTVLESGNVGIGTTSPNAKLEVVGAASVTSFTGSTALGFRITGATSTNDYSGIDFSSSTAIPRARIGSYFAGGGSYLVFGTSNNYSTGITNTALTIDYSGNVGIGTASPTTQLEVYKLLASNTTLQSLLTLNSDFGSAAGTGFGSAIVFRGRTVGNLMQDNAKIAGYNPDASDNGYALGFFTAPNAGVMTERLTIARNGNVGIGTTSPTCRLDISGSHTSGFGIINVNSADSALIALNSSTTYDNGLRLKYQGSDKWLVGIRGDDTFSFSNASDVRRLTIQQGGNVGIGTSSPISITGYGTALNIAANAGGTLVLRDPDTTSGYRVGFFGYQDGILTYGRAADDGTSPQNAIFVIDGVSRVGIGTASPSYKLHVAGDIYSSGTITEASSITLKENLNPITDALDVISSLQGWIYDRKDGTAMNQAGFIAEEVEQVLPNVVSKTEDGTPMGVQYTKIIAYLVESVKELKAQIEHLKK